MLLTRDPEARRPEIWASAGQDGFRQENLLYRIILFERIRAEGLEVEGDRGAHILQRFFVGITLTDNHSLDAQGVSDIAIGVALNNNLQPLGCHRCPDLPSPTILGVLSRSSSQASALSAPEPPDPAALGERERRLWPMLFAQLLGRGRHRLPLPESLALLWAVGPWCGELRQLLLLLSECCDHRLHSLP